MKTRTLGHTDTTVSALCLGTNVFGWNTEERQAHSILSAFVAAGGNFIDTADSYSWWVEGNSGGVSESIIGSWLADQKREDLVVATKVGQMPDFPGYTAAYVHSQLRKSLSNLQTDYVDVYYAHIDDNHQPLEEVATLFHQLVESGLVRHIGISNYNAERTNQWCMFAREQGLHAPVVIEPHYNLLVRKAYEDGLSQLAQMSGLAVVPYAGLARGFLSGRYTGNEEVGSGPRASQALGYATPEGLAVLAEVRALASKHGVEPATVALAWLFSHREITAPIVSASRLEQLAPLVSSTELILTTEEVALLAGLKTGE